MDNVTINTPLTVQQSDCPDWYKDAIIYEIHVRAYFDSDGDGKGDIQGLIAKLPYIKDLGVTAIWILPFYKSPLRDDGYDIAEYTSVHEDYGDIGDFKLLIEKAHLLGLKVITELVLNHTSDQHPWFQRSRTASKGSYWHNFYVWSEKPDKFLEARVIFKDFERSNWTFDPVADQYYWHRFYSHQPDLNFDHPPVRRRLMRIVDFWLNLGVDGLRLDAVPYLYAREDTNCENLPETHRFLKELRKHIDERFQNKMLLAEANQWPEDARDYFGDDDECHMAFHFPLMPRLFMALQMEDRFPVVDILQQTPAVPQNCQWALFLRNHDELTLEMVTDEERDYMYRTFAKDERSRINLGIRRRLAPLLGYNRQKIELMNALLLSLPGTPVLYYGDEIGMGDNIFLGDRNGVRTPMQWNGDRNAGFSRANPQSLYSPVTIDPECHYESVNVEAQLYNSDSLLRFIRQLLTLRKRYPIFGRGSLSIVHSDNPSILSFLRHGVNKTMTEETSYDNRVEDTLLTKQAVSDEEPVLVIANLSRYAQAVQLDLSEWSGYTPREVFGKTLFPQITDGDYKITIGPYSFYWLQLENSTNSSLGNIPYYEIDFPNRWKEFFEPPFVTRLEMLLPDLLTSKKWFPSKDRHINQVTVVDYFPLDSAIKNIMMVLIDVDYYLGEQERFMLSFCRITGEEVDQFEKNNQNSLYLVSKKAYGEKEAIVDAYYMSSFGDMLIKNCSTKRRGNPSTAFLKCDLCGPSEPTYLVGKNDSISGKVISTEQTNTSIVLGTQDGDRIVLKLYRKAESGLNPELEIGTHLANMVNNLPAIEGPRGQSANQQDDHGSDYAVADTHNKRALPVAELKGWFSIIRKSEQPFLLATMHSYIPNEGDAWSNTTRALGVYLEKVLPSIRDILELSPPMQSLTEVALSGAIPDLVNEVYGNSLPLARLLGTRCADLHLALAADDKSEDFRPEMVTQLGQRALYQSMRTNARRTISQLRRQINDLDTKTRPLAKTIVSLEEDILSQLAKVTSVRSGFRLRVHGDLHLGQVLFTGNDYIFIDFEGEPARSVTERRLKRSLLFDIAGVIRSYHYAGHASVYLLQDRGVFDNNIGMEKYSHAADFFAYWNSISFLSGYLNAMSDFAFLPKTPKEINDLLSAHLVDKALYEIRYELAHRPSWLRIALMGLISSMATGTEDDD